MHEAFADTIKGAASGSGIIAFTWWDYIPTWLSTIGLICATILAIHGVLELCIRYYNKYKGKKDE